MKDICKRARSFIFLPADRLQRLEKALTNGAHMVIVDLEDAVAPDAKPADRANLQTQWASFDPMARTRIAIRINAASTPWHEEDCKFINSLATEGLGGLVLAKTESLPPLGRLAQQASGVPLLPFIESADGLAAIDQIDLGLQCAPDERELDTVRLAFVVASRRAGLPGPVDGVTVDLQHTYQRESDTQRSKRFGFTEKLCIHQKQVPTSMLRWANPCPSGTGTPSTRRRQRAAGRRLSVRRRNG